MRQYAVKLRDSAFWTRTDLPDIADLDDNGGDPDGPAWLLIEQYADLAAAQDTLGTSDYEEVEVEVIDCGAAYGILADALRDTGHKDWMGYSKDSILIIVV